MPFSRTTSYTCLLKVTSLKAFSSQQSLGLTQFWLHFYPTLPSSFHSGDDRVSPASFQSPVSELFSWLLHILCCARSVAMMPEMLFGHSFVLSWILALLPFVFLTDRGPLASFSFWHFLKCRCPFKRHFKNTFFLCMIVMARWPESLCKPSLTYFLSLSLSIGPFLVWPEWRIWCMHISSLCIHDYFLQSIRKT